MDRLTKLEEMNAEAELAGGIDKIEKQHAKGKLTARERIIKLLDEDTFMELDKFVTHQCQDFGVEKILGDGVITGYGKSVLL